MKKIAYISITLIVGIAIMSSFNINQQHPGQVIFSQTCNACHTIGEGKRVGPDLKGVNTRRTEAWLIKFIKSSQSMVNSGDPTAVALFNEYNKIPMPDANLTDQQIKDVLAYIKGKSAGTLK